MSKSELKNGAPEDENNGTEENEISDDEYLSDFKKLQPYKYEPCVSKEFIRKLLRKRIIRFRGQMLSDVLVIAKPVGTHAESVCCLDKYEIRGSYFKVFSFAFEIFYPVIY